MGKGTTFPTFQSCGIAEVSRDCEKILDRITADNISVFFKNYGLIPSSPGEEGLRFLINLATPTQSMTNGSMAK